MKTILTRTGPFSERPHFKAGEIEVMCLTELRKAGLLPADPSAVRIERFIERRFGISPRYEAVPDGVLGFTKFGTKGVEDMIIASQLDGDDSDATRRRLRSTLAHEAGHGLLHTYLFALGTKPVSLFGDANNEPEILCRDVQGEATTRQYDGRWWEYQANRAIGGFLLPRPLVERALKPYLIETGALGTRDIKADQEEVAARDLAVIFDVNPAVVRIFLSERSSRETA